MLAYGDQGDPLPVLFENEVASGIRVIFAEAGGLDARCPQRGEHIGYTLYAEIEHVIIGKSTHVHAQLFEGRRRSRAAFQVGADLFDGRAPIGKGAFQIHHVQVAPFKKGNRLSEQRLHIPCGKQRLGLLCGTDISAKQQFHSSSPFTVFALLWESFDRSFSKDCRCGLKPVAAFSFEHRSAKEKAIKKKTLFYGAPPQAPQVFEKT